MAPGLLIAAASAIALSWLMAAAGVAKLGHRRDHARALDAYALLPAGAGRWLVPVLGVAECAAATAIWPGETRVAAAALMLTLLALYSVAIAINLLRGRRDIECGCGGAATHVPLSGWLLARNAALMAAAFAVHAAPQALTRAAASWSAALATFALATLLVLLYNGASFLLSRDVLLQDD
jgi:Methylamine utilisation protein MauE